MDVGLLHAHSGLRYLVLILLLAGIIRSFSALFSQKPWGSFDNLVGKWLLIFTHVQFLIGLVVYFANGWHNQLQHMSEATLRYNALEHPLAMILAVVLITIGRSRGRKAKSDSAKHRLAGVLWLIALVIILSRIPTQSWPGM